MRFGKAAGEVGSADEGFDDVGEDFGGDGGHARGGWGGEDVVCVAGLPFCACEALADDVFVEAEGEGGAGEEAVGDDFT